MLESLKKYDYIIDTRSPNEYQASHIPRAINIPTFTDKEHEYIGSIYKSNTKEAYLIGASTACRNIARHLEIYRDIFDHKYKILLYCARGGNRSFALYSVLKSLKLQVERIEGGYKAYRNEVLAYLNSDVFDKKKFITLCGNTGCGKSELISINQTWSIDIESLCNHYGSSFGHLAGIQPSAKSLQNNIVDEFINKNQNILLIENESKKLGNLILPTNLYSAYQDGIKVYVICEMEHRVKRISKMYKDINGDEFVKAMEKISPYISSNLKNDILQKWHNGEIEQVAELLLDKYYDKVYRKGTYAHILHSDDMSVAQRELANIRESYLNS